MFLLWLGYLGNCIYTHYERANHSNFELNNCCHKAIDCTNKRAQGAGNNFLFPIFLDLGGFANGGLVPEGPCKMVAF